MHHPDDDAAAAQALGQWMGEHALAGYALALPLVLVTTLLFWWSVRRLIARLRPLALPPVASLGLPLAAGFGIVLAAGAVFAEMMESLRAGDALGIFDEALARTLSGTLPAGALQVFSVVTRLGNSGTLIGIVVLVGLLLAWRGRRWLALGWTASCTLHGLLNQALKRLFERARPVHDHGYVVETTFSFPSGHAAGSMVVYGLLAYLGLRLLPSRWHLPLLLATAVLVFTLGVSRVMLQVHWASDVLAGFGSGLAWLTVSVLSIEILRRQRSK